MHHLLSGRSHTSLKSVYIDTHSKAIDFIKEWANSLPLHANWFSFSCVSTNQYGWVLKAYHFKVTKIAMSKTRSELLRN